MAMKACDGAMGQVTQESYEKLVGKDVRPKLGMLVKMSRQGLERRKNANPTRPDPSRAGSGKIVRINANWTCGGC